MRFVVKGTFTMIVDATTPPEAKQTAERILRNEGVRATALEANENRENGKRKKRGGAR